MVFATTSRSRSEVPQLSGGSGQRASVPDVFLLVLAPKPPPLPPYLLLRTMLLLCLLVGLFLCSLQSVCVEKRAQRPQSGFGSLQRVPELARARPSPRGAPSGCCWCRGGGGACVTKFSLFSLRRWFSPCDSMKEYEIYVDTCGEGTTYFLLRANEWDGQWHNVMDLEHTMCASSSRTLALPSEAYDARVRGPPKNNRCCPVSSSGCCTVLITTIFVRKSAYRGP
jgi:hypothetical protein